MYTLGKTQRGDTIIEVLFAIVVIGISLGTSFGIANRSVQIGRAAQEQTEALKLAESVIELVKIDHKSASPTSIRTRSDPSVCVSLDGANTIQINNGNAAQCQNKTSEGLDNGLYSYEVFIVDPVAPDTTPRTYTVTVTWDRIGTSSAERGTLSLSYRPGVL